MAVHSGSLRGIPVEVTITKDGKPFYGTAGWVVDRCPEASLDQLPGWGPGKYHVTAKQENNAAEADFTVE